MGTYDEGAIAISLHGICHNSIDQVSIHRPYVMPNGNEGDMYRAIISNIKNKLIDEVARRLPLKGMDKSMYDGYCMAMSEAQNIIEAYEHEADAIIKYYDGESNTWSPSAPRKYREM